MKKHLSDIQAQFKDSANLFGQRVAAARADIDAAGRARLQAVRRLAETSRARVGDLQGEVVRFRSEAENRVKSIVASGRAVLGTTAIERLRAQPLVARVIGLLAARFGKKAPVAAKNDAAGN